MHCAFMHNKIHNIASIKYIPTVLIKAILCKKVGIRQLYFTLQVA